MPSNFFSWFKTSPRDREFAETLDLVRRVQGMQAQSPFTDEDTLRKFIVDIIFEASERWGMTPGVPLGGALYSVVKELLVFDSLMAELPAESDIETYTVEEGVKLRASLRAHERFLEAQERLLPIWREKLVQIFTGIIDYLPMSVFVDVDERGQADDDSVVLPEAHAYDLCDNLPELLHRLLGTFFDQDIIDVNLFESMRVRIDLNMKIASGVPADATGDYSSKLRAPTDSKIKEPQALVDAYLQGTPFHKLFYRPLPFAIPFPARFEHTHVVGGTGHGKTQLLQFLIHHDLVRAQADGRSVVVLDSQGDLIRTISQLKYFSPDSSPEFAERFVLVDPNDVEHPVCLNMFDFNRDRLSGYAPVDREKILNATIELYEYFFGALLGADLTQRQGLIFRYLARLLIEIPDATIHTLRELMEDGERFRPYMEKLSGTARSFFATQFFDRKFGETKKQILTRLWGVLSNASLERMFSHTRNRIDIFELLNEGKIILINTAKDLLGQEGSAIFGRFFIALIAQAAIQRAAMSPEKRRPAFVYIDEAQDYFDDNIAHLLNQARKYRVGLIFAHQNLDQLGAGLRASVLASTTIKFAGGVSAKDASTLDSEFRCDAQFLMGQQKARSHSEFACYVKNYTAHALSVRVPLGFVEEQPQLEAREYRELLERNRLEYSEPPMVPEDVPFPDFAVRKPAPQRPATKPAVPEPQEIVPEPPIAAESAPEAPVSPQPRPATAKPSQARRNAEVIPEEPAQAGRGGRQHKYLQHLVKRLAEERGFRASIEETILEGAGRVDVSLARDRMRVACQISVTTNKDWELGGIEKCFAAGYAEVVLIGGNERHLKALSKFIESSLDEKDQGKVRYLTAETVVEYLDGLGKPQTTENIVRGYKVRTVHQPVDAEDANARRKAITEVIARSLKTTK